MLTPVSELLKKCSLNGKLTHLTQFDLVDSDEAPQNLQPEVETEQTSGHMASFSGRGYLQLPKSFSNWLRTGGASFEIVTTASNGLILYHGGVEGVAMKDTEFIALAVHDGYMELRYVCLSTSLHVTSLLESQQCCVSKQMYSCQFHLVDTYLSNVLFRNVNAQEYNWSKSACRTLPFICPKPMPMWCIFIRLQG